MDRRITATELARRLGDVLGRIRYRGDRFLVEKNGLPVARIVPVPGAHPATLGEALGAWRAAGPADATLADALDKIGAVDRKPRSPWA
jgi:prevent-host-death family protein